MINQSKVKVLLLQVQPHIYVAYFAVLQYLHLGQPDDVAYLRAHGPSHLLCSPVFFSHH